MPGTKPIDESADRKTYEVTPAEKRETLRWLLLDLAARLHDASPSAVKSDAYFLIEAASRALCPNKAVRTVPKVTDDRVRKAADVLLGAQPGRSTISARIRIVAQHVESAAERMRKEGAIPDPNAPSTLNAAHLLACQLEGVDVAFETLEEPDIALVLTRYYEDKRLVGAVTKLLVRAGALTVKRYAGSDDGVKERRRVRDLVDKALGEKP